MGSIMGGSKSSSESYNKNNDILKSSLMPALGYLTGGGEALNRLVGGSATGFNKFKRAVGYDWELGQGTGDIMSRQAAIGGLDSGATLKALAKYQTGLNNSYLDKYITGTTDLAGLGGKSAELLAQSGQYNKSKSSQSQGFGGILGGLASNTAVFSDRRLKQDIVKIGEHGDGLGVYRYSYVWSPEKTETGVMADEVAALRPWALGPEVKGYKTVNYGRL